jgi:kynurenine formamidase
VSADHQNIAPPARSGVLGAEEFRALFAEVLTWQRWGAADQRGALNLLTPDRVVAAAREVRVGRTVSMGLPIQLAASEDNPAPPLHHMLMVGDVAVGSGSLRFATDYVGMNVHGDAHTHLDALCHVGYEGMLYNGIPGGTVTSAGADALSISVVGTGIVGRGVLLDIPAVRGAPWLEPGDHVTVDDLLRAEVAQGVRVGTGDILCVRVGHRARRDRLGPWDVASSRAGLHPEVVRFLTEREVAALGSDGNNDSAPSVVEGVPFPVHVLAMNAMGLHLADYLQLEDLRTACADLGRWSFFCAIAPLRLSAATGSPVNPIAIF